MEKQRSRAPFPYCLCLFVHFEGTGCLWFSLCCMFIMFIYCYHFVCLRFCLFFFLSRTPSPPPRSSRTHLCQSRRTRRSPEINKNNVRNRSAITGTCTTTSTTTGKHIRYKHLSQEQHRQTKRRRTRWTTHATNSMKTTFARVWVWVSLPRAFLMNRPPLAGIKSPAPSGPLFLRRFMIV